MRKEAQTDLTPAVPRLLLFSQDALPFLPVTQYPQDMNVAAVLNEIQIQEVREMQANQESFSKSYFSWNGLFRECENGQEVSL